MAVTRHTVRWVGAVIALFVAVWALYRLVKALHNPQAAIIAAAMLALSCYHVYFSRNAYPQCISLYFLLVAVGWHLRWHRAFDSCPLAENTSR